MWKMKSPRYPFIKLEPVGKKLVGEKLCYKCWNNWCPDKDEVCPCQNDKRLIC